jgi:hypothetical protein
MPRRCGGRSTSAPCSPTSAPTTSGSRVMLDARRPTPVCWRSAPAPLLPAHRADQHGRECVRRRRGEPGRSGAVARYGTALRMNGVERVAKSLLRHTMFAARERKVFPKQLRGGRDVRVELGGSMSPTPRPLDVPDGSLELIFSEDVFELGNSRTRAPCGALAQARRAGADPARHLHRDRRRSPRRVDPPIAGQRSPPAEERAVGPRARGQRVRTNTFLNPASGAVPTASCSAGTRCLG